MLHERRRVNLGQDAAEWIRSALRKVPLREAALTHAIALRSRAVRLPQNDPADRFLIATAETMGLTFVTADSRIRGAALECAIL